MSDIEDILEMVELHDSAIESLTVKGDGSVELFIDFDEVWNKHLDRDIRGIRFKSVYEISEFKIDRLNIIDSAEVVSMDDYSRGFVTHDLDKAGSVSVVSIDFVAGGSLTVVCSGSAELIRELL